MKAYSTEHWLVLADQLSSIAENFTIPIYPSFTHTSVSHHSLVTHKTMKVAESFDKLFEIPNWVMFQ